MFSVIIPTLNEASLIEETLESVPPDEEPVEVIVADGGSVDATRERASPRARVVTAPRSRALQMNAGARVASGEVFVFLHADTRLPRNGFRLIRSALKDPGMESGTFRLQFDAQTPMLRFYAFCTRFPLPQICFGDRALFVRRSVFEEVGGFPRIPIFEDLQMVRLLHQRGRFRFLTAPVTTAARRFEQNGPILQQLRNGYLWLGFMLGADPHKAARLYPYKMAQSPAQDRST